MSGFGARLLASLVVVGGASVASCSSARDQSEAARVGKTASAVTPTVRTQSARRVCQLIGDTDYQTLAATRSLTEARYGVGHTDLGYPVQQGGRVWFFFGDTTPAQLDADPLGFTDETPDVAGGCPKIDFATPGGGAEDQAITLDGLIKRGFRVPTGFVFDAPNQRFIGVITSSDTPEDQPIHFADSYGVLATSSLAKPRDFRSVAGAPRDSHFFMVAPWIVDDTTVPQISLPPRDKNSDGRVLLVWGSQRPVLNADGTETFRQSPVFLAAVRIEHLALASSWRFFHRDEKGNVTWSGLAKESTPVMFHGAVGELSVTFDEATKQWRMVYAAPFAFFPDVPESQNQGQGIVVMRTAEKPEGPWSKTIPLFVPKEKGDPGWGDEGKGLFYHDANPRLAWTTTPNGTRTLAPIFGDSINQGKWALPPGPGCAANFPSWCPPITVKQDPNDTGVGC